MYNKPNNQTMKRLSLTTSFVVAGLIASAQSISPEVIATAGDHYEAGNVQLSWTIGEPIIETVSAGNNIITQGFHQTELTITSVEENNLSNLDVSVYPNPTSDRVVVSIPDNENDMVAELYDMKGKLIMSENINRTETQREFDLSPLAISYYMLRLTAKEVDYSSTHKIQKTAQ